MLPEKCNKRIQKTGQKYPHQIGQRPSHDAVHRCTGGLPHENRPHDHSTDNNRDSRIDTYGVIFAVVPEPMGFLRNPVTFFRTFLLSFLPLHLSVYLFILVRRTCPRFHGNPGFSSEIIVITVFTAIITTYAVFIIIHAKTTKSFPFYILFIISIINGRFNQTFMKLF